MSIMKRRSTSTIITNDAIAYRTRSSKSLKHQQIHSNTQPRRSSSSSRGRKITDDFSIVGGDEYPNATQFMRQQFSQSAIDPDLMLQAMRETGAVVAGSSVLKAILQSYAGQQLPAGNWQDDDFDIWVRDDPSKYWDPTQAFHNLLVAAGYRHARKFTTEKSQYQRLRRYVKHIHVYEAAAGSNGEEKSPIETVVRRLPVQFIVLYESKPKQRTALIGAPVPKPEPASAVVNSFDINVCQAVFHADASISTMAPITRELHITEAAEQQRPMEWIRTIRRLVKYIGRGFTLNDWNSILSIVAKAIESDIAAKGELGAWEHLVKSRIVNHNRQYIFNLVTSIVRALSTLSSATAPQFQMGFLDKDKKFVPVTDWRQIKLSANSDSVVLSWSAAGGTGGGQLKITNTSQTTRQSPSVRAARPSRVSTNRRDASMTRNT